MSTSYATSSLPPGGFVAGLVRDGRSARKQWQARTHIFWAVCVVVRVGWASLLFWAASLQDRVVPTAIAVLLATGAILFAYKGAQRQVVWWKRGRHAMTYGVATALWVLGILSSENFFQYAASVVMLLDVFYGAMSLLRLQSKMQDEY